MINATAGCGNGKYLGINPAVFKIGSDRCSASVGVARRKDHEVTAPIALAPASLVIKLRRGTNASLNCRALNERASTRLANAIISSF